MKNNVLIVLFYYFATFFILVKVVFCLKNVTLILDPEVVERYQNCTLRCSYDLEGAPLYTVKFFRGNHEFYRYTPSENCTIQFFPIPGINVDTKHSNGTEIVLTKINFQLTGDFSCEVTTDFSFSTGIDTKMMNVIQLPKQPPELWVERRSFNSSHILYARCSSAPSRPPQYLKILINNETVLATSEFDTVSVTKIGIYNGSTTVTCIAQIFDLYKKMVEVQLDSFKDPTPEKVITDNNGREKNCFNPFLVTFTVVISIYLQGV